MTTYTWNIVELEREVDDGFVFTAHYEVVAQNNVYKSGAYGSVSLERPEELIPYDDLTEEIVVDWVKNKLGEEAVLDTETVLQEALDEQASPTKALGVPW